jgi:hypothetical protein
MNSKQHFYKRPKTGHRSHVRFVIHPELHEHYKRIAALNGGKVSRLYRQALEAYAENVLQP